MPPSALTTPSRISGQLSSAMQGMVGDSPVMTVLKNQIEKAASSTATVLIQGESGVGKEGVARALHELRQDRQGDVEKPYVTVNCGAIAPHLIETELLGHDKGSFTGAERQRAGFFERADGGSIFLDEVSETPLAMQVKLLRVLETQRFQRVGGSEELSVKVRLIAASNRDLREEVRAGRFREDLMYRLAVVTLQVPPLRMRGDDVLLLAKHFLKVLNHNDKSQKRFSAACLQQLAAYRWPGNVRELKNTVSRAFILSDDVIELPDGILRSAAKPTVSDQQVTLPIGSSLEQSQRILIEATLRQCDNDKLRAAALLGISLKTLYNRLEAYRASR